MTDEFVGINSHPQNKITIWKRFLVKKKNTFHHAKKKKWRSKLLYFFFLCAIRKLFYISHLKLIPSHSSGIYHLSNMLIKWHISIIRNTWYLILLTYPISIKSSIDIHVGVQLFALRLDLTREKRGNYLVFKIH